MSKDEKFNILKLPTSTRFRATAQKAYNIIFNESLWCWLKKGNSIRFYTDATNLGCVKPYQIIFNIDDIKTMVVDYVLNHTAEFKEFMTDLFFEEDATLRGYMTMKDNQYILRQK